MKTSPEMPPCLLTVRHAPAARLARLAPLVFCALLTASPAGAQPAKVTPASAYPMAPAPGLYLALGEQAGLRALTDDLVARFKQHADIGPAFKDSNARELARSLAEQFCQLTGGPCVYEGANMADAHADMKVTRSQFNTVVELLQQAMDARGIPFARQNQLLALLAPMHRDIVRGH